MRSAAITADHGLVLAMEPFQKILVALLIVTFMLQVGLAMPPGQLRSLRVGAILRGLAVMLVLGPLATVLVGRLLAPPPPVLAALVLLSVVGVLPLASRTAPSVRGSQATGIVLTLCLAVICVFTAVPSALVLLSYTGPLTFHPGSVLKQVLLLQLVPLVLGAIIARTSRRAPAIEKVVGKINVVALAAVVAVIVLPELKAIAAVGWRGVLATVVFALLLAVLAYFVGGPKVEDRRATVSIANMANVGLALAIAAGATDAPRSFKATVLGVFLLRALVGVTLATVWKRREARHELPSTMAHGQGGGV